MKEVVTSHMVPGAATGGETAWLLSKKWRQMKISFLLSSHKQQRERFLHKPIGPEAKAGHGSE